MEYRWIWELEILKTKSESFKHKFGRLRERRRILDVYRRP